MPVWDQVSIAISHLFSQVVNNVGSNLFGWSTRLLRKKTSYLAITAAKKHFRGFTNYTDRKPGRQEAGEPGS